VCVCVRERYLISLEKSKLNLNDLGKEIGREERKKGM